MVVWAAGGAVSLPLSLMMVVMWIKRHSQTVKEDEWRHSCEPHMAHLSTHTQTHKHIYIYIDNGIFTTLSIYIYMCDTLIKTVVSRGETSGSERLLGLMIKNNNNKNNKKWKIFSLSYRDGSSGATARLAEPVPRHDMPAVGGATGGRGGRLVRRGRTGGLGLWILGHPVCLILLWCQKRARRRAIRRDPKNKQTYKRKLKFKRKQEKSKKCFYFILRNI